MVAQEYPSAMTRGTTSPSDRSGAQRSALDRRGRPRWGAGTYALLVVLTLALVVAWGLRAPMVVAVAVTCLVLLASMLLVARPPQPGWQARAVNWAVGVGGIVLILVVVDIATGSPVVVRTYATLAFFTGICSRWIDVYGTPAIWLWHYLRRR